MIFLHEVDNIQKAFIVGVWAYCSTNHFIWYSELSAFDSKYCKKRVERFFRDLGTYKKVNFCVNCI